MASISNDSSTFALKETSCWHYSAEVPRSRTVILRHLPRLCYSKFPDGAPRAPGPSTEAGPSFTLFLESSSQSHQTQGRLPKSPIWLFSRLSALAWGLRMVVRGPGNHHVFWFGFFVLRRRSIAFLRFSNGSTLSPVSKNKLTRSCQPQLR